MPSISIFRSLGDTGYVSAESSIDSDDEKELNHVLEPQNAGNYRKLKKLRKPEAGCRLFAQRSPQMLGVGL